MKSISWLLVGAAAFFATAPASAQPAVGPTLGAPVQSETRVTLSPEKQELIRKHAERTDLPTADLDEPPEVGTVLSRDVALLTLPRDAETVTPEITSYSYIIAEDVIAIVDPATRKVVQLIDR